MALQGGGVNQSVESKPEAEKLYHDAAVLPAPLDFPTPASLGESLEGPESYRPRPFIVTENLFAPGESPSSDGMMS